MTKAEKEVKTKEAPHPFQKECPCEACDYWATRIGLKLPPIDFPRTRDDERDS